MTRFFRKNAPRRRGVAGGAAWALGLGLALGPLVGLSEGHAQGDQPNETLKSIRIKWTGPGAQALGFPDFSAPLTDAGGVRSKRPEARASAHDPDPVSGKLSKWRGILLSDLIDRAILALTPDQRAMADLVTLIDSSGQRALVPRWLINRYPIVIATHQDGKALGPERAPVIFPRASYPKILKEAVPVETFAVAKLVGVEIGDYRVVFEPYLLKRQTDPAAVRGEKLLLQNCSSCHGVGKGPSLKELVQDARLREIETKPHPNVAAAPEVTPRDRRALVNYLLTYRFERGLK